MSERRWAFSHRLAVRFSDCDLLGHVNHAIYFTYFEQCRFEWWRRLGGTTGMPGVGAIIVHAACNFRAPAFASEELEIRLGVGAIGTSSITLDYEILNVASGALIADGRTVIVAYDYEARRSMPLPDETRARLLETQP
jgi:acyl-CoA thioester hydrolase